MSHKIVVIVYANLKRPPERRLQLKWRQMQFWRHSSIRFWHKQDLHCTGYNVEYENNAVVWPFIMFADMHGMILQHAIPKNTTANADYFCKVCIFNLQIDSEKDYKTFINTILSKDNQTITEQFC